MIIEFIVAVVMGSLAALVLIAVLALSGFVMSGFMAFIIGFLGPWVGLGSLAVIKFLR